MRQKLKIAIIGGGGRTGKYLVDQLVNHGHSVKLLLRNPQNINVQNSLIEIVKGDAVDPASIHSLLAGCQAIISTVGQRKDEPLVARQATINVLKAMEAHQIQRYLLVTGLNVDTPFDRKGLQTSMATEWMKTNYSIYHE
jgi:putative NADH-flavin reductase